MYSQIVGMVLFFLGLNLLFSYLHVFLKIFGDLHIKMQKTTCYCCALCNSKLGIRYVYTQRTRILCNFFYCCKMGIFCLLLTKIYPFMATGLSWAALHFIVAPHWPMQTSLITGAYAVFTKSDVLLTQFQSQDRSQSGFKDGNVFFNWFYIPA